MKKKFLWNTTASLLSQLATLVYGFVLPRLILEAFGSEINGLTQSIKQFLSIISFLELGVGQVIRSALYRPLAEKNSGGISAILVSGGKFFRRIAAILAIYVAALMVGYPWLVDTQQDWLFTAALIGAMSIGSFAQYYFGIVDGLLLVADQRGYVQYSANILTALLNTFVGIWMIRGGCSIQAVKIAASLIFLLKPLVCRLYIRRHYCIDRKITYESEPIAQKWNGVAQHVSAVVLEGTDNIVLTLFSTLSNVSVYSVYYLVIGGIMQLYTSATAGIQSAVGALWAKQNRDALNRLFSGIEMGLHFAVVFLFSCTGVLIVPFVQVYTNGLTDVDYIQPLFAGLLVLAYGIRCLRTPYNILILAGGHYKQTQACHVTAAVLNLGTSVVAVWQWGLVGVALGTLVAMLYQTLWMAVYTSRNLLRWPLRKVIKQLTVDALTAALTVLATGWIRLDSVSYLGWFWMAVRVAVIAMAVTALMAAAFYRRELVQFLQWAFRKQNGK